MPLAADPTEIGGLTGWIAGVIDSLGAPGVGLLVALENAIPPIPSEVVLAMAGYLAGEGRSNFFAVLVAATLGSVFGAVALYYLGAGIGEDRLKRWLDRIPLVELEDLEKADRWFERHARATVFFGRMVPVVRTIVSIPAGANRMPMGEFLLLTTVGSGIWNALFIGLGYALGDRWEDVERYSSWVDYFLIAAFGLAAARWVVKRVRKRRESRSARAERDRAR